MDTNAQEYCLSAVAYLKVEGPYEGPVLKLSQEDSPVLRSIGHGLLVSYLVDKGESFSYVQHRDLNEANLDSDQLHAEAIRNLAAFAETRVEVRPYGNIYAVLMGGNFEASLILVDQFWSEWYAQLAPNGFVAAFPARDILSFCDASSSVAIGELEMLCERIKGKADHPLSQDLFRRVGTEWQPLYRQS